MNQPVWKTKQMLAAAVLGLCALGFGLYVLLRSSDEQRVLAAFARSVQTVSVKEGDTPLSRLARINDTFKETLGENATVRVAELGVAASGRKRAAEAAAHAGTVYQSAQADIVRVDTRIDDAKQNAKLTATVVVTGSVGGNRRVDTREVNVLLHKGDGWRITSLEVLPASP